MKSEKSDGFVLIIVVLVMGLIGTQIFVLTASSNAVLFQSNNTYLKAVEQNLIASGLAWTEKNIKSRDIDNFGKEMRLDITDMSIQKASLSVFVKKPENIKTEVSINVFCACGKQTFRHQKKFLLGL